MHAQIKKVIESIRPLPGKRVAVTFTSGQHTPLGMVLGDMFYRTNLTDLLDPGTSGGYPANGGEHTFWLTCDPRDAIAFIEELKETMEARRTMSDEHRQVISELSFISQELHSFRRRMG